MILNVNSVISLGYCVSQTNRISLIFAFEVPLILTAMKTILVIESKSEILENLIEGFEMEGYKVLGTGGGAEGIKLAREFIPDLIVSEILIGTMNGYEVLHALLSSSKTFEIPFIFSTTQSERKDRMMAFELGADDYIVKPYGLEEIYTMAKRWIKSGSERGTKMDAICQSQLNTFTLNKRAALFMA
jgi:DNA-binding response OmpR family regulator